jgi:processive 1,2-diacylglycerol beta-glucosyltransferase
MIVLRDKETGDTLGEISAQELQFLVDAFEEEGRDDRDYYVDASSPDYLIEQFGGAASRIAGLLRDALRGREGFDIQWERSYDGDEPPGDDDADELDESI